MPTNVHFNLSDSLPVCSRKLESADLSHSVSGHPGHAGRSNPQGVAVRELSNWQGDTLNM